MDKKSLIQQYESEKKSPGCVTGMAAKVITQMNVVFSSPHISMIQMAIYI